MRKGIVNVKQAMEIMKENHLKGLAKISRD